jgi:hypothetical protein
VLTFKQFISEKFHLTLKYHHGLNAKLWENSELKDGIASYLIKNARKFASFADVPRVAVNDIVMTGGNCNYNYTKFSDIDVHIMCNEIDLDDTEYFKKKSEWTKEHPEIKIQGYPVEYYIQDETEHFPNGQGVYSLLHGKWLVEPKHLDSVDILKDPKVLEQVQFYIQTAKDLVKNGTEQDILDFKTKLWKMRSAGLEQGGEFSFENVMYKDLRNRGWVDKLNHKLDELTK